MSAEHPQLLDANEDNDAVADQHVSVQSPAFETFVVRFSPDVATFSGQDGSHINVPLHVLHRSTQLQDTFCTIQEDDVWEESITLPRGVLRGWLGSLHDFGIRKDDTLATTGSDKPECLLERNLPLIRAADFLNDEDCLNKLISRTANGLYPPLGTARSQVLDKQVLNELPEDLVLKVLRACKQPFFRHLAVLPKELHMAALHAVCPGIYASASLQLERLKSQAEVDSVTEFLPQFPHLQTFEVSGVPGQPRYIGDDLSVQVLRLEQLQKLSLNHIRLGVTCTSAEAGFTRRIPELQHLTWLSLSDIGSQRHLNVTGLAEGLLGLQEHQKLIHLDVSSNKYSDSDAQDIAAAVCGFTSLRCLNVNFTKILPDAAGVCMKSSALCSLEQLESAGRWVNDARGLEFLSHIGNMSSLQRLNLSGQNFEASSFSALHDSFPGLTSLTYLGLANSSLTQEQLIRLAVEIENLSALQELDIRHILFRDAVWDALAPARDRGVKIVH